MNNETVSSNDPKITIESETVAEITEKRSRFIATTVPVQNENDARAFIERTKGKYSDATHNVFAYYIDRGTNARYSDDGEPQGTAGMPVLNVLKMSGLTDICTVVTRYFGGILLGAGGLVRAYSSAARASLDSAKYVVFKSFSVFRAIVSYSEYQKICRLAEPRDVMIDSAEFGEGVEIILSVLSEKEESVTDMIRDVTLGKNSAQPLRKENRPYPAEL